MAARSGGGLTQPLAIGEVVGATDAALGDGGVDAPWRGGTAGGSDSPLGVAGHSLGAATVHPIRMSVATIITTHCGSSKSTSVHCRMRSSGRCGGPGVW